MRPAEFQAFAAALRDPDAPLPEGLRSPAGIALAERFAVYRNNVHASLVDALADHFPVVQALVGRDFFRAMARRYVLLQKPCEASLLRYGETFPAFITAFEPAEELPFLADMAGLEDAWQQSWSATDAGAVELRSLANVEPDALLRARLRMHPAVRLVRSAWPIGTLWQRHQEQVSDPGDISWQAESVLLTRPSADVKLRIVPDSIATLTLALMEGASVERALSLALAEDALLDPGKALKELIDDGIAMEISET